MPLIPAKPVLELVVPGKPLPYKKKRWHPKPQQEQMDSIAAYARKWGPPAPLDGALAVEVLCAFRVPKSVSQREAKLRLAGDAWHTQTPDSTNLLKLVEDSLTGIVWHDDSQAAFSACKKRWVDEGAGFTRIKVWQLPL